jgi:hypothetical protein
MTLMKMRDKFVSYDNNNNMKKFNYFFYKFIIISNILYNTYNKMETEMCLLYSAAFEFFMLIIILIIYYSKKIKPEHLTICLLGTYITAHGISDIAHWASHKF